VLIIILILDEGPNSRQILIQRRFDSFDIAQIKRSAYHGKLAVQRARSGGGGKDCIWYIFDPRFVVPEYLVDFRYVRDAPRSSEGLRSCHSLSSAEPACSGNGQEKDSERLVCGGDTGEEFDVDCASFDAARAGVPAPCEVRPLLCEGLKGFLEVAGPVGRAGSEPKLRPLPAVIRKRAEAALAMAPEVLSRAKGPS
jgi:hypothetical protein